MSSFALEETEVRKEAVQYWWLFPLTGILWLVFLGFWAAGYFGREAFLLVIFVAASCMTRGITEIVLAIKLHGLAKAA